MKNPNGFGTVYKLSGARRNPYRAAVTAGWEIINGEAKQKRLTVGYYRSRKEALEALAAYSANPYDLDGGITFAELYEKWSSEYFETIAASSTRTIKSAFSYTTQIHGMKVKDLRVSHLEGCMREAPSTNIAERIKSMYNLMYKYAMKHELVDKDYASLCYSPKRTEPQIKRVNFSHEEILTLFSKMPKWGDMVLVGTYTGFRPSELCEIKLSDIDLNELTIKGGLKTDAGRNRIVPIHRAIVSLIQSRYDFARQINAEYLFCDDRGIQTTYNSYRNRFKSVCEYLGAKHTMHDTRHTFITLAKEAGMNEYILKRIVGHAVRDVTEKVYTHRTLEELRQEMEKLPDLRQ